MPRLPVSGPRFDALGGSLSFHSSFLSLLHSSNQIIIKFVTSLIMCGLVVSSWSSGHLPHLLIHHDNDKTNSMLFFKVS